MKQCFMANVLHQRPRTTGVACKQNAVAGSAACGGSALCCRSSSVAKIVEFDQQASRNRPSGNLTTNLYPAGHVAIVFACRHVISDFKASFEAAVDRIETATDHSILHAASGRQRETEVIRVHPAICGPC